MLLHSSARLTQKLCCYMWEGKANNCNSILLCDVLRGERPHVLIDPGYIKNEMGEPCLDSLNQAMEKDGFRMEDVGLVITTHSHPDHFEAAEPIVRQNDALFALSQEEYEFYKKTGKVFFQSFGASAPTIRPFFYLKEGDLRLGKDGLSMAVISTPGHTPGSLSFYLKEEKILLAGDVIFSGSMGRTDFPGGSLSLLQKSIDRLSQLDVEYLVPGHSTEDGGIIAGADRVKRNFYVVKMLI